MPRAPLHALLLAQAVAIASGGPALAGDDGVLLTVLAGEVTARAPKAAEFRPAASGARLAEGTRLRTAAGSEAELAFPDGTRSRIRAGTEVVLRLPGGGEPGGLVLFFGRAWSKVVRAAGGESSFEVRSANAVAGVRGTEFEVGVADDGSARVVVDEGRVRVEDDGEAARVDVGAGDEVETDAAGALGEKKAAPQDRDWEGWFSARARTLQEQGLRVAKALDGRLARRKAKVDKLVAEQRSLRQRIERLERRKARGAAVDAELAEALAALERVTARLLDTSKRLEAAFGLFARWGELARGGRMAGGAEVGRMAEGVAKMAADFADMIEEGTDLSPEGMEETLEELRDPKQRRRPKKGSAKDELF